MQVSRLRKGFENNSLANEKLSKTKLHKIGQSGWFLGRSLGPLAATTSAAIQSNIFWSNMTTLIISNEEMEDILKIIRSPKECSLLIKGISGTIKNKAKKQGGEFFSILLGTLGTSLLTGNGTIRAGQGTIATFLHRFEILLPRFENPALIYNLFALIWNPENYP